MEHTADVKTIVTIIKEIVKGYYCIIYRDTNSYNINKFKKEDFISIFKEDNQQWHIESNADLIRFVLTDSTDTTATDSDILKTFNAYEADGEVRIARVSVVCDWSIFELAFDGKEPKTVLEMARSEKNKFFQKIFSHVNH